MATYLLTGGTGLIGSAITRKLLGNGHQLIILSRDPGKVHRIFGEQVTAIDDLQQIPAAQQIDTVINLAGAPIASKRWSDKQKQILRNSRIVLTEQLVSWFHQRSQKPSALISGSAVGWYGDQQAELITEHSDYRDDFAHRLCEDWEQAALQAKPLGMRVAIVRTGLVIAKDGGFLAKMLLPFKLGLGGPIADGRQYMPWIHIDDIRDLFIFLAEHESASGVFNGTAPTPVSNQLFTQVLAAALNRPAFFRVPACVLKATLGEMASLLLGGQRAIPEKALTAGFHFQYTELRPALDAVLSQK